VPALFNLPLGHGEHLATIPLGVTATIDGDERKLTIDEPALEGTPQLAAASKASASRT
jgi:muramoyltetrapeptide carboxypeptidase LdcA involved in peptidoglycan recycling